MFKIFVATILLSTPLGLSWQSKQPDIPRIEGYQYYYGDRNWGTIVYLSKQDIIGLESELQLIFLGKKISSAILILGPAGLNDYNCIRKYKKI